MSEEALAGQRSQEGGRGGGGEGAVRETIPAATLTPRE